LDGDFDLIIEQRILLESDSTHVTNTNFPFCRVKLRNGLEVATKYEKYYFPHGQTNSVNWVDTLKYGNRIDKISEWSTDTSFGRYMWVVPPSAFWGSNGYWYNLTDAERYIGIRMKIGSNYKLGWIKVNEISRRNISFISYAIEK